MSEKSRKSRIEKTLKRFGAESVEKLMDLADNEETPQKLRADILKWFAEMEFGKPTAKQTVAAEQDGDIVLDGELDAWSE